MSETLTRDDLYDLIFGKLPDWMQPLQRQQAALDVLDELEPIIGHRGIGDNQPPEPIEGETEEDRLKRIDPTKLLVVPVAQLPDLFAVQFPDLVKRAAEFKEQALKWRADHVTVKGGLIDIANDDENNDLSDTMRQWRDFGGDDGEVHAARRACKRQVFDGIKALDAWFQDLADPIMEIHGPAKRAPLGTAQERQTKYLTDKADRERRERERIAAEAAADARRKADEARLAAEQEAARSKALEATGVDARTAGDIAATVTDRAAEEADAAIATSSLIGQAAQAPVADLVRSRSALGSTTTLGGTYDFDETKVNIREMCQGVVDGTVPVTFMTVVPQAIRQAIRAKISPLRSCPGLVIAQTFAARRSGR